MAGGRRVIGVWTNLSTGRWTKAASLMPAAPHGWGYYVYPLLEGDRFVGGIEAKGDRQAGILHVTGFWPEAGVRWGQGRIARLQVELGRFARMAGLHANSFAPQDF